MSRSLILLQVYIISLLYATKVDSFSQHTKLNYMLYNIFCIFIGVTFANLGREGKESGKMRDPICYAQKRTTITKTNAPTYHKPVHKIGDKIRNKLSTTTLRLITSVTSVRIRNIVLTECLTILITGICIQS